MLDCLNCVFIYFWGKRLGLDISYSSIMTDQAK